jgi:hypothetical protein
MKKIIAVSIICVLTLCSCFGPKVRGNGTIKTETRSLASFESITCDGGYEIQITCGAQQSVTIETDENLLPSIKTEVNGSELHIYTKKNLSPTNEIRIVITVQKLTDFTVDGFLKGTIKNIHADAFHFTGNGSARINLSGVAENLKLIINGSGTIDADSLTAQDAKLRIEGSGDIRCHAITSLDVRIDGSGSVKYMGEPKHIDQSINGSGSIKREE